MPADTCGVCGKQSDADNREYWSWRARSVDKTLVLCPRHKKAFVKARLERGQAVDADLECTRQRLMLKFEFDWLANEKRAAQREAS